MQLGSVHDKIIAALIDADYNAVNELTSAVKPTMLPSSDFSLKLKTSCIIGHAIRTHTDLYLDSIKSGRPNQYTRENILKSLKCISDNWLVLAKWFPLSSQQYKISPYFTVVSSDMAVGNYSVDDCFLENAFKIISDLGYDINHETDGSSSNVVSKILTDYKRSGLDITKSRINAAINSSFRFDFYMHNILLSLCRSVSESDSKQDNDALWNFVVESGLNKTNVSYKYSCNQASIEMMSLGYFDEASRLMADPRTEGMFNINASSVNGENLVFTICHSEDSVAAARFLSSLPPDARKGMATAKDLKGVSMMHYAASKLSKCLLEFSLNNSGDKTYKNDNGLLPIDYIRPSNSKYPPISIDYHTEIVSLVDPGHVDVASKLFACINLSLTDKIKSWLAENDISSVHRRHGKYPLELALQIHLNGYETDIIELLHEASSVDSTFIKKHKLLEYLLASRCNKKTLDFFIDKNIGFNELSDYKDMPEIYSLRKTSSPFFIQPKNTAVANAQIISFCSTVLDKTDPFWHLRDDNIDDYMLSIKHSAEAILSSQKTLNLVSVSSSIIPGQLLQQAKDLATGCLSRFYEIDKKMNERKSRNFIDLYCDITSLAIDVSSIRNYSILSDSGLFIPLSRIFSDNFNNKDATMALKELILSRISKHSLSLTIDTDSGQGRSGRGRLI